MSAPRVLAKEVGDRDRGILAWFIKNSVAANLLIAVVIFAGLLAMCGTKQEVFPEVELDMILVQVPYPGASPEEVEKGVTLATEEALRGIDGIKRVTSTSGEGFAVVAITLQLGVDGNETLNLVRAAIDRVTSYPDTAEKPVVFLATNRQRVISLVLYGDQSEAALKAVAESTRDALLQHPDVSYVELSGTRAPEIAVEIPQSTLRKYRLSHDVVAGAIRAASLELPAGRIKTEGGEILVRTVERREQAEDLADVPVVPMADGTFVKLGQIATIRDGFADTDETSEWNGQRAVTLEVFRVGEEKPLEVAAAVKQFVAELGPKLPPGVQASTWVDMSELYEGRMNLLIDNAIQGLILVIIMLGLFLELKLAFWVTLGIPTSFFGAALFLEPANVTINMLSLFAFILALGSVVDDAINIGEATQRYRDEGFSRMDAAILGVKEVARPVTFAIVVIMIAYVPMLFVPGVSGKFFRQIPVVVIGVLAISLAESLFILPAHLAHSKESRGRWLRAIDARQAKIAGWLERMIATYYVPLMARAVRRRYVTLPIAFSLLLVTCGVVAGGHVKLTPFPNIESDFVRYEVRLPFGAAPERTRAAADELVRTAREVMDENGGYEKLARGIFTVVGSASGGGGPGGAMQTGTGGHIAQVMVYLVPLDRRTLHAADFSRAWRAKMKDYPGIDSTSVVDTTGFSAGAAVAVELSHPQSDQLELAAKRLAQEVRQFAGIKDVDDGFSDGKPQLDLTLTDAGRAAGFTSVDLARSIRAALFGAEAYRLQRGRDEVRVYVRLPDEERNSEYAFEELVLRTPSGGEMQLAAVANTERGTSYTEIRRIDGRRAVEVTAGIDDAVGNGTEITQKINTDILPRLLAEFPGLSWEVGGEQKEFQESIVSLFKGMGIAILVMYVLLAIAFRSYIQPIAVLMAIPFGLVGAVAGHILMGYTLSIMSFMGIIALAGVAINDSLVYVDAINAMKEAGKSPDEAAVDAGAIRARPILLTAATAFLGLAPLIFETEMQARFLIPMALSLGFGIIFSTLVTLLVVPAFYLLLTHDIPRGLFRPRVDPSSGGPAALDGSMHSREAAPSAPVA